MIYKWNRHGVAGVNAQAAGEELERIRVNNNGRLEPQDVVVAARSEDNPLHPAFEWNDALAAEAYRVDQARYVIRSIEVVIEPEKAPKPVRAFVSVVRGEDRSYTSVSHAMSDPILRQQVLSAAMKEMEAWRDRYAELVELADVFAAIDKARAA